MDAAYRLETQEGVLILTELLVYRTRIYDTETSNSMVSEEGRDFSTQMMCHDASRVSCLMVQDAETLLNPLLCSDRL